MAMQLEEEARALGKRQRKQFSHVGLVAAAFMIVTFLAQIAVISFAGFINYLLGGIIDLFSGPGILLLSAIPMYFVAFPVSVALIQLIPRCGRAQSQPWGIGKFAACLVISVGIGLAGNLLGQFVEWFKPSVGDDSQLNELLMNSGLWMTVLFTVLMAPVVEELFFRKLLMDRLLGYPYVRPDVWYGTREFLPVLLCLWDWCAVGLCVRQDGKGGLYHCFPHDF